jgi:hypothetical protein
MKKINLNLIGERLLGLIGSYIIFYTLSPLAWVGILFLITSAIILVVNITNEKITKVKKELTPKTDKRKTGF